MNKVKTRCTVCGKSFKTPSLKKTICPNCEADAKRAKHQTTATETHVAPVTASTVDVRAALRAAQENQGQFGAYRPPAAQVTHAPAQAQPARAAAPQHAARQVRSEPRGPVKRPTERKQRPPKPPREPKPRLVTKPFEPTEDQIQAVRNRYLELARPEFNGIRHQIAREFGIPLRNVKSIIKETREDTHIQSWWEQDGGQPPAEVIDRVRDLYVSLLPEPEVGVHKRIAAELHMTNTSVYQAIGAIREQLALPRYADRSAPIDARVDEVESHMTADHAQAASGQQ